MAINTYALLKAEIKVWMGDDNLSDTRVSNIIQLAEARLNRYLKPVRADASLTGTLDSRDIDISSYDIIRPVNLWLTTYDVDERLLYKADGNFAYQDSSSHPSIWTVDSDNDTINFDCPLDKAHTFRLRYYGRLALSDSATTNQLLTDHPDVYLASCLLWGANLDRNDRHLMILKSGLDEFLKETNSYLGEANRGITTIDPAFTQYGNGGYNWESDQ